MFAGVYWAARDFYSDRSVGVWNYFYIPGVIACWFVLPGVALIQCAYGLFAFFKSKRRSAIIHLISSAAIVILTVIFFTVFEDHLLITV